jgi:hypothetical protein
MNPNHATKMKRRMIAHCAAAAIALLTLATPARGTVPIPITNAGFENPVVSVEGDYTGSIIGWSVVNGGGIGVWNVETTDYPAQAPEGFNVAFIYNATGVAGCSQVLSGAIGQFQADASYTLTVKVGDSLGYAFPGYKVQLLADGTVLAEDDNTLAPITNGTFATSTVNYTYNAGLHAALVGKPLEIRLLSKGLIAGENEVEFDNVQLSATLANPIANPGGPYSMLSIGSLALNGSGSLPADGQTIADPSGYEWDLNTNDNGGNFNADITGAMPAAISYATLTGIYGMTPGENTIKLRVTDAAAKTSINSTTVTLTVASSDADLFSLETTPVMDLTPSFDSATLSYTATAPYAAASMTVKPTKTDAGATIGISFDGEIYNSITSGTASAPILLDVGVAKVIYLQVTAQDTTTQKTYRLTVTRSAPSANANLADLTTTPATALTPTFSPATLEYATTVAYPISSMTVTPTAADTLATIKVNGTTVASGTESAPIPLSVGANVINTVVTAEDPIVPPQTYKLTVTVTVADPFAIPGGPYAVSFGGSLALNGSASLPADGQTITAPSGYEWDLNINDNGGAFNADFTGPTPPSITYPDLQSVHGMTVGPNTIRLRVTDSSPKTSTVEGTVTINPPVSIFTSGTVQPAFNGADQGYFNSPLPSTAGDKWFAEISGAGQTKGQTFTVTGDRLLKGITYRLANSMAQPTKVYVVRIGTVDTATNVFYPLFSDQITQTVSWGATGVTDSYGTWVFATPFKLPGLPAGTVYGFDIAMKSSSSAWQTGIPYPTYLNTNVFAGGFKYTCAQTGTQGSASNTMQPDSGRDREFHLDMDAITIADTTAPTLVSISDNVSGGPIYADQVQVIYTLTFDEAINASTIDLADFENLGAGVSIDSVVSVQNTTPYPAASVVKVVLGISGTGTLKLGVKSGSNIADLAAPTPNLVTSPAADDTMIAVNTGTNPGTGDRWWDLAITGITDGASQGGTGTWNSTTTNWDRGFGFAAPVQWNNSNNDNAIFGGTAGTVTLGENINLQNLTFGAVNGYFIGDTAEDNTLTFSGTKTITVNGSGSAGDATIRAGITGSPTLNITGRADNNATHFSLLPTANVTMALGTVNMLNTNGSNKRLVLGGASLGNVANRVTWPNTGNQLFLVKNGTGTWTVESDLVLDDGKIFVEDGTLILGGANNTNSHSINIGRTSLNVSTNKGKFMSAGTFTILDAREDFIVYNGATLAPGINGVGTITVGWNSTQAGPGEVQLQTGSIYEWQVGAAATDTVHVKKRTGTLVANLLVQNITLKILDAGGTPANGTVQLPVFTYDTGTPAVTRSIGTVSFNTTDLVGKGWTVGTLALTDNGTGTIYLTGLSKPAAGYALWAATNAPSGTAGADYDGDGVNNGVEYVLGGTKDTNDLAKLPITSTTPGGDVLFTFVRDQASIDGTTTVAIEVGTTLAAWPDSYSVPGTAVANNPGVTVVKDSPGAGKDTVTLTLPRAPDAKKFARL